MGPAAVFAAPLTASQAAPITVSLGWLVGSVLAAVFSALLVVVTRRRWADLTRWTPGVELTAAVVAAVLVGVRWGAGTAGLGAPADLGPAPVLLSRVAEAASWPILAAGLTLLSAVDLDRHLLPIRLVYPTLAGVLATYLVAAATGIGGWPLARAVAAGVATGLLFLVVHLLRPEGMGFGDVRLAGLVGVATGWMGWSTVVVGVLVGLGSGALVGLLGMLSGRLGRHDALPFGPFLAAGAVVALLGHPW